MPIEKPKKPTELVPRAFGGEKNNFSEDLQSTGFEANIPQTYNGDNINYQLDATGKELDYVEKVVDFINNTPVNHVPFVNENNQLDYVDKDELGGSGQYIGQKILSLDPLYEDGLHLFDGGLLLAGGFYNEFITKYIAKLYQTNPERFCTEEEYQASVTNYGACSKYVYTEDVSVRLPKTSSAHGGLIKSYKTGNNWYRIYADGWCEQGGVSTGSGDLTVSLLKPYVDTNYSVLLSYVDTTANNALYIKNNSVWDKTTSSFKQRGSDSSISKQWQACGYIDISDYKVEPMYEYIVVATGTKSDIDTNIDNIAVDLNNKIDKQELVEVKVVTETYQNGTSWYRVYSDGWCEQGGVTGDLSANASNTINLLKPYKDTNYVVIANGHYSTSSGTGGVDVFHSAPLTTDTFNINRDYTSGAQVSKANWKACGYIEV